MQLVVHREVFLRDSGDARKKMGVDMEPLAQGRTLGRSLVTCVSSMGLSPHILKMGLGLLGQTMRRAEGAGGMGQLGAEPGGQVAQEQQMLEGPLWRLPEDGSAVDCAIASHYFLPAF